MNNAETKSQWLQRIANTNGLETSDIEEIAQIFIEDSYPHLNVLQKAFVDDNLDCAINAARSLTRTSAVIGLDKITKCSYSIVTQLKNKDFSLYDNTLDELNKELRYFSKRIKV